MLRDISVRWPREAGENTRYDKKIDFNYPPGAGGKHPIMSQESASDTHQGTPELCNPSNNIGQDHLCN